MRRRSGITSIIVEGRDDRLFYENRTNGSYCRVYIGESKSNVIEAIQILEESGTPGVLGIVDSDFDRVQGRMLDSTNIISSHTNDLESMLIQSGALDRVVGELGSRQKIEKMVLSVGESITRAAVPIGLLRLHSEREALNLRFEGLPYQSFVDLSRGETNLHGLAQAVSNRSMMPGLNLHEIEAKVAELANLEHDMWDICVGEDLVGLLSLGLRSMFGSQQSLNVTPVRLKESLRLAFGPADFGQCPVAGQITNWETLNSPYRVF